MKFSKTPLKDITLRWTSRITFLAFLLFPVSCENVTASREPFINRSEASPELSASRPREAKPSSLLAGASKKEITPPLGTPLAGYGRRRGKPSRGVHDPLHVRALALKNQTNLLIFASCDLVAINEDLYRKVLEKLNQETVIQKSDLFLLATHTHSGSGGIGKRFLDRIIAGRYNPKVFKLTVDRIGEAIHEALQDLKPARLGMSHIPLENMIENRMIEEGAVDSELKVLRVDRQGKPLALLVNLAAHPTVLSADNLFFSADFPGSMQSALESLYPHSVCLFSNGAAGDQRIKGFTEYQDFERAKAIGESLAQKVIEISKTPPEESEAKITTLQSTLHLPPVKIRWDFLRLPSWIGNRFISRWAVLNAATLNDILFISIPGEMTSELGLEIKQEAERNHLNPLILGYANGYLGYIIPEKYYDSNQYEAEVTFFGPKLDRYFKEHVFSLIHQLKGEKA